MWYCLDCERTFNNYDIVGVCPCCGSTEVEPLESSATQSLDNMQHEIDKANESLQGSDALLEQLADKYGCELYDVNLYAIKLPLWNEALSFEDITYAVADLARCVEGKYIAEMRKRFVHTFLEDVNLLA